MNFGQLQARAKSLCSLGGWTDVSPAPSWKSLVNEALQEWSWESEYQIATDTVTLVAGTDVYTLPNAPPDWKRITDAVIGTVASGTGTVLMLYDENRLRREHPTWTTEGQSTPDRFWLPGTNQIQFWPIPSASGDVVTVRGPRADTPLVLSTDTPNCPSHYHEGIALLAAWRHGKLYDTTGKAAEYRKEAMAIMDSMGVYLSEQESPGFQRRVQRGAAERYPFGWYRWQP